MKTIEAISGREKPDNLEVWDAYLAALTVMETAAKHVMQVARRVDVIDGNLCRALILISEAMTAFIDDDEALAIDRDTPAIEVISGLTLIESKTLGRELAAGVATKSISVIERLLAEKAELAYCISVLSDELDAPFKSPNDSGKSGHPASTTEIPPTGSQSVEDAPSGPESAFSLTTGDPHFNPVEIVKINGYLFLPADMAAKAQAMWAKRTYSPEDRERAIVWITDNWHGDVCYEIDGIAAALGLTPEEV